MPDIEDGESVEIQGSAKDPYVMKNTGGVYSCTCPAWMHQSIGIEQRTCKHLRKYRGEQAEIERLGSLPERAVAPRRVKTAGEDGGADDDTRDGDGDGESFTAPALLLAHSWNGDIDPTNWWMSEKLDGVRAYWDGQRFISRQGNVYMAPDWFIEGLPKDIHLDGELWLARKAFQRAVSIVRRQDKNSQWREITFVVFDAPLHGGTFEERIEFVSHTLGSLKPAHAKMLEQQVCTSVNHLRDELNRIESLGGEGMMLRKPQSRYERGRSSTLLKVKTFHDAEAKVVEHLPGTGKHKGRLGALSVELPDGKRFSVGTGFSDYEREHPPAIGAVITFRYQELSDGGIPRFPAFVRERTDVDSLETNLEASPLASPAMPPAKPARTPAKPQVPPAQPATAHGTRTFVYRSEHGEVTWSIATADCLVSMELCSTSGNETSSKQFPTKEAANANAERQIAQKVRAGFRERK